jgi:hypothetical protein
VLALVLLAAAPGSLTAAAISAALFGLGYNVALTVQALWSARVFANRPSAGLAAVMFLSAAGQLIVPLVAGVSPTRPGCKRCSPARPRLWPPPRS